MTRPSDDVGSGHSVWLTPEGAVEERLSRRIRRLAKRFGTPAFDPHVTVVSRLTQERAELAAGLRELALQLSPVEVRLRGIGWTDEYFRCVFLRAEKTRPLTRLRERVRRRFGEGSGSTFEPHLSLVYGRLSKSVQRSLAEELEEESDLAFTSTELVLVSTEGRTEAWRVASRFPLGKR